MLDSDWEAEFCRVAESHPRVRAYAKNHNVGLEVPYRYGSETRRYLPDFIVLVDDGHGEGDPLHLVVEILAHVKPSDPRRRLASEQTGEWMYVFNASVGGEDLYVKVVLRGDCVVISFHGQEDGDDDE